MDQLVLEPTAVAEPGLTANRPAARAKLPEAPDTSHLITEDDAPVENWFSEKNQRLLAGPINDAGPRLFGGRPFVAAANVGVFNSIRQPAIVPDVFLSLDADMGADWWETSGRSYLVWETGKPPDVVIEIVSNTKGNELHRKRRRYAYMRVIYYVVFDPNLQIQDEPLVVYELRGDNYEKRADHFLPGVGLGLTIWHGDFEGKQANWLRWCDQEGNLILTGHEEAEQERARAEQEKERAEQEKERAEQEKERAEQEKERAEQEKERAEQEKERAERLVAQLRLLGIEPEV